MIEKLNENNTQKEMMCEDKNCCKLKNNHQKSIQTLQHTETFVSNLNNNILIYKKELDALTNKVAELEKNHQKSMRTLQHTETFVSNLSKNIVNYKKELDEFQLKKINNEAINLKVCDLTKKVADSKNNNETINPKVCDYPKICDLTNKVADSKKIMQPPQHTDIFEELGVPTRKVKIMNMDKKTLICEEVFVAQWDSNTSKGLAYFDNH
jgi:flagellar biosynthesis chaperone FliJ